MEKMYTVCTFLTISKQSFLTTALKDKYIPSGDLMGDISSQQGYNKDFLLQAESHDHSTMSYSAAMICGIGKDQPHEMSSTIFSTMLSSCVNIYTTLQLVACQ